MIDLRHVRHLLAMASHSTVQAAVDALHHRTAATSKSIDETGFALGEAVFDRSVAARPWMWDPRRGQVSHRAE